MGGASGFPIEDADLEGVPFLSHPPLGPVVGHSILGEVPLKGLEPVHQFQCGAMRKHQSISVGPYIGADSRPSLLLLGLDCLAPAPNPLLNNELAAAISRAH